MVRILHELLTRSILTFFHSVFPVGISGMITLPVTAQMYHSLVQQQMPNNDNTVCVTPMQVQNFISSNSLCGSIANSNLNTSTTYIMTASNRNVISLPLQASSGSMKTIMSSPPTVQNIYAPKSRTIVKKTLIKKRVLNLAMAKPKPTTTSSQTDSRKNVNNNSTNVKNRNQKAVQHKVEKLQTSQSNPDAIDDRNVSLMDDPGDAAKVKEEFTTVETE